MSRANATEQTWQGQTVVGPQQLVVSVMDCDMLLSAFGSPSHACIKGARGRPEQNADQAM